MTRKYAAIGSVSHATLRSEDLLEAFANELQWQIERNGEWLAADHKTRDYLNAVLGASNDLWLEDSKGNPVLPDDDDGQMAVAEMINETLPNVLTEYFAAPYCYFGPHPGDGADFGFWPDDIENIKEQVGFVSSREQEWPDDDYTGEWLHINERGNCTLYVRENGKDTEIWSIV